MKQKQRLIKTFAGLQIQIFILITSIITSYGYAWMSHTKINDVFITTMLRSFIIIADISLFLAIGYMIDFKRGIVIGYIYKILAFLKLNQQQIISQYDFIYKTTGISFGLILYYKLTLFIIIYTASYIVQIDYQDDIIKKNTIQQQQKLLLKSQKQLLKQQNKQNKSNIKNNKQNIKNNKLVIKNKQNKKNEQNKNNNEKIQQKRINQIGQYQYIINNEIINQQINNNVYQQSCQQQQPQQQYQEQQQQIHYSQQQQNQIQQQNKLQQQQINNKTKKSTQSTQSLQINKTINKIKLSLRYHKQDQFYKKLEIFYFIFYNSTCILILFPLQQYIIDFTKALYYTQSIHFFTQISNINAINSQIIWYMNFQTILNVIIYWIIILIGQFYIKKKFPSIIKSYILQIPIKFILIQLMSFIMLFIILYTTPISQSTILIINSQDNNNSSNNSNKQIRQLQQLSLISLINWQIYIVAYVIHTLLPIMISFLLLRLYLGQTYYLNKLVSIKYSYHNNDQDNTSNLDFIFYQSIIQDDITHVRHFIIDSSQLIPRHKLKRYTEQSKLKHYVNQSTILEIQSLFQDFLVLDLYNKLSRFLIIPIFYLILIIFLVSMNINDTYIVSLDQFYINIPSILLILALFLIYKYQSTVNIFYPKPLIYLNKKWRQFLAQRKAFNFIRLTHFYAIIFSIWIYRIYSQIFLPTHVTLQQKIKLTFYHYYSSSSLYHIELMSPLLGGWAQYFTTHSSSCDYDVLQLTIDSVMILLIVIQVIGQKYYFNKKQTKKDPILMILKLITPIYALFVFVVNMQCLQWSRVIFCCSLCVGVMFMQNNWKQLKRGIIRNDQGQYQ